MNHWNHSDDVLSVAISLPKVCEVGRGAIARWERVRLPGLVFRPLPVWSGMRRRFRERLAVRLRPVKRSFPPRRDPPRFLTSSGTGSSGVSAGGAGDALGFARVGSVDGGAGGGAGFAAGGGLGFARLGEAGWLNGGVFAP